MLKSKDSNHFVFLGATLLLVLLFAISSSIASDIDITDNSVATNLENVELKYNEAKEITPKGNTFDDIQNAIIFDAKDGDTIILDQKLYEGKGNMIVINKSVSIVGKSGITPILDAKGLSGILVIQEKGVNIAIKNCEFVNGMNNYGGAMQISGNNIEISDCTFRNNEANGGGAIYTQYVLDPQAIEGNDLKIKNCNFYNNQAYLAAGAIGAYGNRTEIKDCIFDSNRVYNKNKENENVYGGAVQLGKLNSYTVSNCINCIFINNSVTSTVPGYFSHGGAGCLRDGVGYINCKFISNTADFGGALVYHEAGIVDNCIFENNTALKRFGGALSTGNQQSSMNLIVKNSIFKGNNAPIGGACYLIGKDMIIKNCTLEDNLAYENGGAVYIQSSSTIIQDCKINNNIANVDGGALYINANRILVENNEFNYNEAIPDIKKLDDGLGGAIYVNATEVNINSNNFRYNVARNGSAIYIDKYAKTTTINNNEMLENQAWVYRLPVYAPTNPVLYGENVTIKSIIHGGNNIAKYGDVTVSNAIYNNGLSSTLSVNGETPVLGATDTGILYQDDREFNTDILLTVIHENGNIVYNKTLKSNAYGEVGDILENLEVGKYNVLATHFEDNYYKEIANSTSFTVLPQADVKINKIKEESDFNYKDYVMWNLTIKNNGPNKATDIIIQDLIPEGLIFIKSNYGQYNPTTGILKIDGIEPSQSITLSIITQINKTGKIVNNANVTAGEYDPDLTNNHDFDFIEVNPSADLSIEKSVSQKNPNFGDEISWKIIAINNGPDDATDVKVIDNLPEGLIWISDDSNGDYNPNTGIWNIKNLAKDETKTLTIKCKVNKTGKLTNNVSISGNEYDWNNSNNNDSESIEVPKAADLEVSKEVNNSNPNYLDAIKWTITVKNNGPDSATGVILKDIMPEGLVILTHSGGADFDGITWNVGELANGEVKELYIYCRVNKTGDFENIVTVKGNEFDQNETNNNDSEVIHVKTAADLKVIKTVNNKNPIFQDTICWSIEIKNNGPDMATDVVVTDIIPVGLTYLKNTASKGSYDIKTGLWKINAINPFSSEYLDIYCKVDKTGKFVNNVSVRANEYDYDESNNNDSEFIIVNSSIDLAIEVLVNDSTPDYHDFISWTLIAKNYGPDNATGVKVLNTLPNGLIWLNEGQIPDFNNGIWNIGNLKVGETKSIEILCKVNKTGNINNLASISGNEFDINLDNNKDSKSINVRPAADLEITKTASKIEYNVGEFIDYVVNIVNNGPDTAHNVKVEDILEEGIDFISYSANKGIFNNNGSLWTVEELDAGQSATLLFKTLSNKVGEVFNRVSVSSDEYDYNIDNNFDQLSVLVKNGSNIPNNTSETKVTSKINTAAAYKSVLEVKKTGSPIVILVMALSILISFGLGYFPKK